MNPVEQRRQASAIQVLRRVALEEAARAGEIASILAEVEPDAVWMAEEQAAALRAAAERVGR